MREMTPAMLSNVEAHFTDQSNPLRRDTPTLRRLMSPEPNQTVTFTTGGSEVNLRNFAVVQANDCAAVYPMVVVACSAEETLVTFKKIRVIFSR
jgi:hypothetical protein